VPRLLSVLSRRGPDRPELHRCPRWRWLPAGAAATAPSTASTAATTASSGAGGSSGAAVYLADNSGLGSILVDGRRAR
jgi:hypothetical protein